MSSGYRDVAKVLSGAMTRNALRGVFKILVAGFLAPQALGTLRSVYSLFRIVASLAELGLDYAAVTFVAGARKGERGSEVGQILKVTFSIKLATATLLAVGGNVVAPWLAGSLLGDASLVPYVRILFLAIGGQLLWKFLSSYFSGHQDFTRLALFLTTIPALLLAIGGGLMIAGEFTLERAILLHLLAPAAAVAVWWRSIDLSFVRVGWDRATARRVVSFGNWVYLANVASSARSHLNTLLLKNPRLSGSVAAGEMASGLYAFGADLANEVTVLSQSLFTVLLPRASGMTTAAELRRMLRRAYLHLAGLLVVLAAAGFLARPAILLLGRFRESYLEYLPSLSIFAILYAGGLLTLAAIPIRAALYAMKLPQVGVYLEVTTTVMLVVGSLILIPLYGGEGAAVMVLVQRAVSLVALLAYGLIRLRDWSGAESR